MIEAAPQAANATRPRSYIVVFARGIDGAGLPSEFQGAGCFVCDEALALAIDRKPIQSVLLKGAGEPTASILPNWMTGYSAAFSTQQTASGEKRCSPIRARRR